MIVKLLGILDLLVAIIFWIFGIFHIEILAGFVLVLGFILLAKGVGFAVTSNFVSILDIVASLVILASTAINLPAVVVIIVALFLIQKGIFSLLS